MEKIWTGLKRQLHLIDEESEVKESLGFYLAWLPHDMKSLVLKEQLFNANASDATRIALFAAVERSEELSDYVKWFLKSKKVMGEELRTVARYLLFASLRWKLHSSLSWPVSKALFTVMEDSPSAEPYGIHNLFIAQYQGAHKSYWTTIISRKRLWHEPGEDIQESVMRFDGMDGITLDHIVYSVLLKKTEGDRTNVQVKVKEARNVLLEKLEIEEIQTMEYIDPSMRARSSMLLFYGSCFVPDDDYRLHNNLEGIENFRWKWQGIVPSDQRLPRKPIEERLNEIIFARIKHINADDDIELNQAIDRDHFLRDHPWHYSFSSYISPRHDPPGTPRTGLMILPYPIFVSFATIDVIAAKGMTTITLQFGGIVAEVETRTARVMPAYIASKSNLSYQPFNVMFIGDDMTKDDAERIGLVQTQRETIAKEQSSSAPLLMW